MSNLRFFEDCSITTQLISSILQFYDRFVTKSYGTTAIETTLWLFKKLPDIYVAISTFFEKDDTSLFGVVPTHLCLHILSEVKNIGIVILLVLAIMNLKKELSTTNDSLTTVKNNLFATQTSLTETREELVTTRDSLTTVKNNLFATQTSLTETREELVTTQTDLVTTRDILMNSCVITFKNQSPFNQATWNYFNNTQVFSSIELQTMIQDYPLVTAELDISLTNYSSQPQLGNSNVMLDWTKLSLFPLLKTLTVEGYAFIGFSEFATSSSLEQLVITNKGVRDGTPGATNIFNENKSFKWLPRFPNIRSINIGGLYHFDTSIDLLDFLPNCPNLKYIRIHSASSSLTRYCLENHIELDRINY
jgi:hypothetical protein